MYLFLISLCNAREFVGNCQWVAAVELTKILTYLFPSLTFFLASAFLVYLFLISFCNGRVFVSNCQWVGAMTVDPHSHLLKKKTLALHFSSFVSNLPLAHLRQQRLSLTVGWWVKPYIAYCYNLLTVEMGDSWAESVERMDHFWGVRQCSYCWSKRVVDRKYRACEPFKECGSFNTSRWASMGWPNLLFKGVCHW